MNTLQARFNDEALRQLPKTYASIKNADVKTRSCMVSHTLRVLMNSRTCLDDMSAGQIENLDNEVIETIKAREWM